MSTEPGFWERYWHAQPPSVTVVTMTEVMDRIKMQYLRPLLQPAGRTLEVGSGSARLSCFLAQAGYRTTCLDFTRSALRAARPNYEEARRPGTFVLGDGGRLPIHTGGVDVVLSTGLLEHFADLNPIVQEMVRVLRPGGLFYSEIVPRKFSLFRSLDWIGRLKQRCVGAGHQGEELYERSFTSREITALLERAGLTQVHVFAAGVTPPYLPLLSRSERLRRAQVRLVDWTKRLWRSLDGTRLAAWLGFYYFAWGLKPGTAREGEA